MFRREGSYLLLFAYTHQLHDAQTPPARDGVIHRSKRSFVDLYVLFSVGFNGFICETKHEQHTESDCV